MLRHPRSDRDATTAFRSGGGVSFATAERLSRRRWLVVVIVAGLVAAACGPGEDEADQGPQVETVDAAAAAGRRPTGVDDSESLDRVDSDGVDGTDGAEVGATTALPQASDDADEPPVASEYPEITEEITPPPEGVKALRTPSGVLLGVTGVASEGYVVLTPCGGTTVFALGETVGQAQVVIDPGHGGDEAGAEAPGLTEAQINLSVARATATVLRERGVSVELLRDADYRIPIRVRAQLADLIAPRAFVSIHHNTPASRPSPDPGTEVFVQTSSEESRRLGGLLYEEVFGALSQFDVEWTSRDDAGVLTVVNDEGEDAYGIARYPVTPSALVEMAYLGNESEAVLLATPEYLDAAAVSLADGIERFLTTQDPGSGFVEAPRLFNPSGSTGGTTGCVDPAFQ